MAQQRLPYLLNRYLSKRCSKEELKEFYTFVDDAANERELNDLLDQTITQTQSEQVLSETRQYEIIKHIVAHHPIVESTGVEKTVVRKRVRSLRFIGAAAAILLVLGTGLYFYRDVILSSSKDSSALLNLSKHDIPPGSNKATLTLANGKVIKLSNVKTGVVIDASKLTYSDGSKVEDSNISDHHPELVSGPQTIQTPRGGTYQIILPDGTHIYLNAASSIKFPATFAGLKERKVELTGEAYFVVKHNAKQPFRVETQGQIVEDMGTAFNINSYADETSTETTLIEGSAKVVTLNSGQHDIILKPGQQSVLKDQTIEVKDVDAEEAIAWKKGLFIFEGESLKNIMNKVARWYDVEVIYENEPNSNHVFQGKIARNRSISEVLKMIEYTGLVHFKIEGRRIVVKN